MTELAPHSTAWSDAQLPAAVAAAASWRGVMRQLGLNPSNGAATQTIRRHAAWLGLDTSHFRNNRSWSDAKRVQVKTTTFKSKDGWLARIGRRPYSIGNNAPLVPYDPEVIDLFFIVDGDLTVYVIPSRAVGGRTQILLRSYTKYIVGNAAGLIAARPSVA